MLEYLKLIPKFSKEMLKINNISGIECVSMSDKTENINPTIYINLMDKTHIKLKTKESILEFVKNLKYE